MEAGYNHFEGQEAHQRGFCGPDACILSPLPNLLLDGAAVVAEVVHQPRLEPMNGSGLTGKATLRLCGASLRVTVTADRQVNVDLRHCRPTSSAPGGGECDELLLVITACGALRPGAISSATFDLASRANFTTLDDAHLVQLPPDMLSSLRPAAVLGMAAGGWPGSIGGSNSPSAEFAAPLVASPRCTSDDPYLMGRIKDEIGAALRAADPDVASRHVQLARLLAHRLQSLGPAAPVASRRLG